MTNNPSPFSAANQSFDAAFAAATGLPTSQPADYGVAAELAQAEAVTLTLIDRLRANKGAHVSFTLATQDNTAARVRGTLSEVFTDHVIVAPEKGFLLVRPSMIVSAHGLGPGGTAVAGPDATWTWRATLRRWHRFDVVAYTTVPGPIRGRLERIHADHFELETGQGSVSLAWTQCVAVLNLNASRSFGNDEFVV